MSEPKLYVFTTPGTEEPVTLCADDAVQKLCESLREMDAALRKMAGKWKSAAGGLREAAQVPGSICYGNLNAKGRADAYALCAEEVMRLLEGT